MASYLGLGDTLLDPHKRPQILASLAAAFGLMTVGTAIAWSSTGIPSLLKTEGFEDLTIEQQSWIASVVPLSALVSSTFGGTSLDRIGRKDSMILQAAVSVMGWLMIAYADSVEMLCIGRAITGLCVGIAALAPLVYVSEICEAEIRGTMSGCCQVFAAFGTVFSYTLGAVTSWQWTAIGSACISLIFMISVMQFPDSPRYLLDSGQEKEAVESLCFFRSKTVVEEVEDEINAIKKNSVAIKRETTSWKKLFTKRFLKPIFISMTLMMFQQLSGFNAILYYTVSIFEMAGDSLDPNLSTIIVGLLYAMATTISAILSDLTGRRILMITSEVFMAFAMAALGLYFYFQHTGSAALVSIDWVPLTALMVFVGGFGFAMGPIPWVVMTEIIPNPVIGIASGLSTGVHYLFAFLVTKYFQPLTEILGIYWIFWIFACICIAGIAFVFLVVPETKLKSLEEIQLFFGPRLSLADITASFSRSTTNIYKTFMNK